MVRLSVVRAATGILRGPIACQWAFGETTGGQMRRTTCVAAAFVVLGAALVGCTVTPLNGDLPHAPPTSEPTSLPTVGPSGEPTTPGALISVSPYIAFAGVDDGATTVSASGAVDNILETGGTCTFTFRSGQKTVEAVAEGHTDATYTSCGVVTEEITQFSSGNWNVVLDYESASAQGTSAPVTFEVP